jgi:hypothetical protein
MAKPTEWMPVFAVIPALKSFYAAHPDEKKVKQQEPKKEPEDRLERVGTAMAIAGGGYRVILNTRTAPRQLLIRPPKPNERMDDLAVRGE